MPSVGRIATASLPRALLGCGLLFPGVLENAPSVNRELPRDSAGSEPIDSLPVGLGTLRQNEVSVTLRRGELQIRVTPLNKSVIRVTTPDTYERLS